MSFDSIIDQPFAVELCGQWLKKNTTNPLLFYGPAGAGKKTLALELAKALNCVPSPALRAPSPMGRGPTPERDVSLLPMGEGGRRPDEGCDSCLSCKKIAAGNHPDVRVIDLAWQALERKEPIEKQQSLRIETVIHERHRLLQSPVEGMWKVSILDDAHRMTPDAANVLLKILEEPPAATAIFILTPFRDRLFATIVSRCQPVRFRYREPKLSHEQIEAHHQADVLWQSLSTLSPSRVMHETGGRKSFKPNRAEIEQQIQSLLVPAARALRAGDPQAQISVQVIQNALTQLRQNVQPALVYDHLLLQLSRQPHE